MNILPTALAISGIGIIVLLLVLAALAGIVYLMTRYIVEKDDKEESTDAEAAPIKVENEEPKSDYQLAAALAVAIARAQADTQQVVYDEPGATDFNAWRQNGLLRRLNQSSMIRRTR